MLGGGGGNAALVIVDAEAGAGDEDLESPLYRDGD